ncbi:protein transport protein Sec24B [Diachasma alloeum]|uniref:protein transport protein Sec24B n=1 Tax=Diachasma alloeum TaxID=454923 RepID=UPI0007384F17|nr:protein transport protein Sec24B [Diachasma alloeum]
MSQPSGYQPSYPDLLKSGAAPPPPPLASMVNGQSSAIPPIQNGTQQQAAALFKNPTGTPSSQSSRDPSRETSRDPSPTQHLYTQYRPQLTRPPMPPMNGQQSQPILQERQYPLVPHQHMTNPPRPGLPPNSQESMRPHNLPPSNPNLNPQYPPINTPVSNVNHQQWKHSTSAQQHQDSSLNSAMQKQPLIQLATSPQGNQSNVQNSSRQLASHPAQMQYMNQVSPPQVPQAPQPLQNPQQQQQGLQNNYLNQPSTIPSTYPNQNVYSSCANLPSQRKYPQAPFTGPPPRESNIGYQHYQQQQQQQQQQPYFGQMANVPLDNLSKRYPGAPGYTNDASMNQLNTQMGSLSVTKTGFNSLWGQQSLDLLQCRTVLPCEKVEPPKIGLQQEFLDSVNCSPEIFRCTLTKVPESNSLLQKSRLPLGILIHPFKDLNHLSVIQCSTIVRCRACRTYINPFVYFVDSKRWKCNLCYRVNELPEEFQFDPVTKTYGDPSRRPEVKTSTIEFIAPSEYMLRPPQPAVYLFLLDVSRLAVESGYLNIVCQVISEELSKLPGDSRTQVGFLAIDSAVHFFSMPDNVSQPHELIMLDVDDVFLPCPDNLIVNLREREELIRDLLAQLPTKFSGTHDTNSALGAGLQSAFKLMSATGGRVTVFQSCLPNIGPGTLQSREDPNTRASKDVQHLNPATDFYKRLALDCSGQQIAVDLFLLNSQYSDLATLSGMCKFSGGCIYHIPLFRYNKPQHNDTLERMLRRYLTRKIGFEAVMRIRCTRGLSIHTFHGNFFVRSTDLLSLPNVNPDAGFGMQVSIEENLSDIQTVCFQAALLYTSSKGERRIRVHTLCLPVTASLTDILYSADQQCIIGLLSKMAVDRAQQSTLTDARDALINVAIDVLSTYKISQSALSGGLMAPMNLKLLPLYIIALLKFTAFRLGTSTRLDDRVYSMCQMKTLPLSQLIQTVYPDFYPIHALDDTKNTKDIDGKVCPQPPRLHLSAEKLDFRGAFLMDAGDRIFIYIGKNIDSQFCCNVLGVSAYSSIPEEMYELPELETVESQRLRNFVFSLQDEKPYHASIQIIRDDSHFRSLVIERLIEDRCESALSYYEFLQHIKTQIK